MEDDISKLFNNCHISWDTLYMSFLWYPQGEETNLITLYSIYINIKIILCSRIPWVYQNNYGKWEQ